MLREQHYLTVGAIGYGIYQATQAPSISIPKAEEKEKDTPTVIYRYGGTNPGNLTPSQRDVDLLPITGKWLSFSPIPKSGAAMTTIEALNAKGVVYMRLKTEQHMFISCWWDYVRLGQRWLEFDLDASSKIG